MKACVAIVLGAGMLGFGGMALADGQAVATATTQAVSTAVTAGPSAAANQQIASLKQMLETNVITQQQYDAAVAKLTGVAATTQPAATQPAVSLTLLSGRWSVRRSKADDSSPLGGLLGQAIPADTWVVSVKDGKVSVTEEIPHKAKKKGKPTVDSIALNVTESKLDGNKLTLTVSQTVSGKLAQETTTTSYVIQLGTETTLSGTYTRDRTVPTPLGTTKLHDEGNVQLTKGA